MFTPASYEVPTPSEVFSDQVRKTRDQKGKLTQEQLAARLAELGVPLPATAITKLEKRKRNVTIEEALAIAVALDVSPLALLLPPDDSERVKLTPADLVGFSAGAVRHWIDGGFPLTALLHDREDGTEPEHRTLDGKVISKAEALERQRFYAEHVSNEQWLIRQDPALAQLLNDVSAYARARANGDAPTARAILDLVEREVQRQGEDLNKEVWG